MNELMDFAERSASLPASTIGTLVRIDDQGRPWVELDNEIGTPRLALSTVQIAADQDPSPIGRPVLIAIVGEDRPVVVGFLHHQILQEPVAEPEFGVSPEMPKTITANQKRVVISSDTEIVLRCGESLLQLRKDGRVLLKGCDVVSRASRKNRIKGGSVAIN